MQVQALGGDGTTDRTELSQWQAGLSQPQAGLSHLRADCANCVGLCCVVPALSVSADFALDKPAGQPCPNLGEHFSCSIHAELRPRGFAGCTVYDCYGAGQKVTQVTFGGASWKHSSRTAERMTAVFPVMRLLHELLWYLTQAEALRACAPISGELAGALALTESMTHLPADQLVLADSAGHRDDVNQLLRAASDLARAESIGARADHRGADLMGANLTGVDLRGASLRGALLIGANLRGVDLDLADLTGADVRGADVRGARLAGALFLTQPQLTSAVGDGVTTIPDSLSKPSHWSVT